MAGPWQRKVRVSLLSPNKVVDEFGNEGTWTMVYNQGFHIEINGRSYFGYSSYKKVLVFAHLTGWLAVWPEEAFCRADCNCLWLFPGGPAGDELLP